MFFYNSFLDFNVEKDWKWKKVGKNSKMSHGWDWTHIVEMSSWTGLKLFASLCKEQYRNDGLTTLCYVFHESCWINRGRLILILIWSSPVNHFCWIIFTAQWLTGEVSFSYWFGLPLLIIWLVEDITYNTLPPPLGYVHKYNLHI